MTDEKYTTWNSMEKAIERKNRQIEVMEKALKFYKKYCIYKLDIYCVPTGEYTSRIEKDCGEKARNALDKVRKMRGK